MAKKPSASEALYNMDRVIVGNQMIIMRSLQALLPANSAQATALNIRVHDIKGWWRDKFGEEVGFSSELGDRPNGENR